MPTTVYFATNRVVSGDLGVVASYQVAMVPPSNTAMITYGTAFVDGIDIPNNVQGNITSLNDLSLGQFSQDAMGDLGAPGRNLLIFLHGFDNSFEDAITRAAFNREWLAASGVPGADTTVIAFSWPSEGKAISFPILQEDYLADQGMARNSGLAIMSFLANLAPILTAARSSGQKVTLLAHSMGNLALQSAIENWFLHGNAATPLFDGAILAAGDCGYAAFEPPNNAGLSGLTSLATKVAIYFSNVDHVLQISMLVNLGAQRLGQDGPRNRSDTVRFPPALYAMVDCTEDQDYDFNILTSHQYYRMSPSVRALIAAEMS